jgi:hypothetical protein
LLIIKQTESSGIPKIFMEEDFRILRDDISGFSTPSGLARVYWNIRYRVTQQVFL